MKTLIISLYDGTTDCAAAILNEDSRLTTVEVSRNIYHLFYDRAWCNTSSDPDDMAKKAKLNRFLTDYEAVILCENGHIEKIK